MRTMQSLLTTGIALLFIIHGNIQDLPFEPEIPIEVDNESSTTRLVVFEGFLRYG